MFIDGQKVATLRGADAADQFKVMVADYIEEALRRGREDRCRMSSFWQRLLTGEAARRRWIGLGVLAAMLLVLWLTGNLRQM